MSEWLTTNEAAEFLGVSASTLYRMERQGLIEAIRTPGGQRRFLKELLEVYMTQSKSIKAPQNPSQYKTGAGGETTIKEQHSLFETRPFDTPTLPMSATSRMQSMLAHHTRRDFQYDYVFGRDVKDWLCEWEFRGSNTKTYTHGFHTYPAMFIPQVARKLILAFSYPGDTVLDIFCGSGTALVESKLTGRHSIGIELNPLAVLIAKVKTTPIDPQHLAHAYQQVIDTYTAHPFVPTTFSRESNIDFWFSQQAIGKLNAVKQAILGLQDRNLIDFFFVALSEIVRRASLTKHGEFKLVRDKKKVANGVDIDIFVSFCDIAQNNILAMKEFRLDTTDAQAHIIYGDSTQDQGLLEESVDLILTSPPYGDSRTTVAYGQFSRLPAQWLDLLPNEKKNLDSSLLGGNSQVELEDAVVSRSDTLHQAICLIADRDEHRAREVVSF
jgi:site-specific DNA-methyltransferase (cytosine-N4-specific)